MLSAIAPAPMVRCYLILGDVSLFWGVFAVLRRPSPLRMGKNNSPTTLPETLVTHPTCALSAANAQRRRTRIVMKRCFMTIRREWYACLHCGGIHFHAPDGINWANTASTNTPRKSQQWRHARRRELKQTIFKRNAHHLAYSTSL
jgi:hypothetical protein